MFSDQEKQWISGLASGSIRNLRDLIDQFAMEPSKENGPPFGEYQRRDQLRTSSYTEFTIPAGFNAYDYVLCFRALISYLVAENMVTVFDSRIGISISIKPGKVSYSDDENERQQSISNVALLVGSQSPVLPVGREYQYEYYQVMPSLRRLIEDDYVLRDDLEFATLKKQSEDARAEARKAQRRSSVAIGITIAVSIFSLGVQLYQAQSVAQIEVQSLPTVKTKLVK
jgi:hypothetical protein